MRQTRAWCRVGKRSHSLGSDGWCRLTHTSYRFSQTHTPLTDSHRHASTGASEAEDQLASTHPSTFSFPPCTDRQVDNPFRHSRKPVSSPWQARFVTRASPFRHPRKPVSSSAQGHSVSRARHFRQPCKGGLSLSQGTFVSRAHLEEQERDEAPGLSVAQRPVDGTDDGGGVCGA
eukprot:6187023-Pleurochrysis_carterae.AAC.1